MLIFSYIMTSISYTHACKHRCKNLKKSKMQNAHDPFASIRIQCSKANSHNLPAGVFHILLQGSGSVGCFKPARVARLWITSAGSGRCQCATVFRLLDPTVTVNMVSWGSPLALSALNISSSVKSSPRLIINSGASPVVSPLLVV